MLRAFLQPIIKELAQQVIFSKKKRSWGVRGILRGLRGVLSQNTPLSPYKKNLKYFLKGMA
ncbi:hypothetical protein COL0001_11660 [Helicobacter pylori]